MPKKKTGGKVDLEYGAPKRNFTRNQAPGPGGKVNHEGLSGRAVPRGRFTDETSGKGAGSRKLRGSSAFKPGKGR